MPGANFYISVKQVIESDRRLKVVSILKHTGIHVSNLDLKDNEDHLNIEVEDNGFILPPINLYESPSPTRSEGNIITYVAGYIVHSLCKRISCENCKNVILSNEILPNLEIQSGDCENFLSNVNRGGLILPSNQVVTLCFYGYQCFSYLTQSNTLSDFLKCSKPSSTYIAFCLQSIFDSFNLSFDVLCSISHNVKPIFCRILLSFFNTLSKNFVNNLTHSSCAQRKINKLSSTSSSH